MRKTCKYRLYPTKQQQRLLAQHPEEGRWRYNHLLAERRDAWEQRRESVRLDDQHATLPARKAERPRLAGVQSPVVHTVAVRSARALPAFLRRSKAGEVPGVPGYPRFRGQGRYDRLTFPQVPVGGKLEAGAPRVSVMPVGRSTLLSHRPLGGTPQTAIMRRSSTGKWYVTCSCECAEPSPLPETGQPVGVDVGLKTLASLSTGQAMATPRFFRQEETTLAKAQRRLRKDAKGTCRTAHRRGPRLCAQHLAPQRLRPATPSSHRERR